MRQPHVSIPQPARHVTAGSARTSRRCQAATLQVLAGACCVGLPSSITPSNSLIMLSRETLCPPAAASLRSVGPSSWCEPHMMSSEALCPAAAATRVRKLGASQPGDSTAPGCSCTCSATLSLLLPCSHQALDSAIAALHTMHMGADSTKGTWRMPGGPDRCSAPAGTPASIGRSHAGSCMGREKAGRAAGCR